MSLIIIFPKITTRKPCYRKDDRTMRPIYGHPENFRESLATPICLLFPKLLMTVVVINRMKVHQMAHVGVSQSRGLKLFGREIIFEEFQPM